MKLRSLGRAISQKLSPSIRNLSRMGITRYRYMIEGGIIPDWIQYPALISNEKYDVRVSK